MNEAYFLFFFLFVFFLMIRRPPRSTLDRSSAASDVYKRQELKIELEAQLEKRLAVEEELGNARRDLDAVEHESVSYTHLRAHETVLDFVCRLLLEKKLKASR